MVPKRQRARKKINLSNKKKENYESYIANKTDLDKAGNNQYLFQLKKTKEKL